MSKHLEEVREALDRLAGCGLSREQNGEAIRVFAALIRHEQEVAELVEALRIAQSCLPQGTTADEVFDLIDAALRPFEDKK